MKPPKTAERIGRFFSDSRTGKYVTGDLEEEYNLIIQESGNKRAVFWYWKQVLLSILPYILSSVAWNFIMIKSYLKMTYRSLKKNRLFSYISIFSLSVAIGCALALFVIMDLLLYIDHFHENADEIYQVKTVTKINDRNELWGNSPVPLGPALKADFPSIKSMVRLTYGNGIVRNNDRVFNERFLFADEDFMNMFSFPLKHGDRNALNEKNAVILTEDMATKYFGDADPVGQPITIKFRDGANITFFIRAVTENMPVSASFRFNFLIPYSHWLDFDRDTGSQWEKTTRAMFIQVGIPSELERIKTGFGRYINIQNDADPEWAAVDFIFDPLLNLVWSAYETRNSLAFGQGATGVIVFMLIGIFLLLLACFNYVNIAIASNTKRLKEIGIRKVLGGSRAGIIRQFLGENIILCMLALIIGAVLTQYVFLPVIEMSTDVEIMNSIFMGEDLWLILLGILLFTGIIGGAYPAFYISAFRPVQIFQKKLKFSRRNPFTKILLISQFSVNFLLITLCIVVRMNAEYQRGLDWGYDQDRLVVVPINAGSYFDPFNSEISMNPSVVHTAGARHHIGHSYANDIVEYQERQYDVKRFDVGAGYLESMKIRLISGQLFEADKEAEMETSLIVNEKFLISMGWEDPFEKQIKLNNKYYNIIGVVEDFHYSDFMDSIDPVMFRFTGKESYNYIVVRTGGESVEESGNFLRETWKRLIPDEPYEGFYQDEVFNGYFNGEDRISSLFGFFAAIALVISCMGLFGLVSINITKRTKEIGIRKVLGADFANLFNLINRPFLILLAVSLSSGSILSYFLINAVMEAMHEYHISVSAVHIVITSSFIVFTAVIAAFSQIYKAANSNPIDSIRYE